MDMSDESLTADPRVDLNQEEVDVLSIELEKMLESRDPRGYHGHVLRNVLMKLPDSEYGRGDHADV
jgi:hypothetical protein